MAGKSYKVGQGNPRDVEQLRRFVQRELRRIALVLGTPPNFKFGELLNVDTETNPLREGQGIWYDADTETWRNRGGLYEAFPTGLIAGGELNIVAGEIEALEGVGVTVDSYTDPLSPPVAKAVQWPTIQQPITAAPAQAGSVVWFAIRITTTPADPPDVGGVPYFIGELVQYAQRPNPQVAREQIFLGLAVHNGAEWGEVSNPKVVNQSAETLREVLTAVTGPSTIIQGGRVDEEPLFKLSQEAGTIWEQNRNWHNDKANPNREVLPAANPIQFRYTNRDFSTVGVLTDTVVPDFWDNNGTVEPVPGPANAATIQRLYLDIADNYWMLYGQEVYQNFLEANANLLSDNPVVPLLLQNAIFLGWVVAEQAKTDWNPSEAIFIPATGGQTIAGAGAPITDHDNLNGITPDNHHNQVHLFWGTDHSDVDAADTPTDGQVPVYRTGTGKWQAETLDLTTEWGEITGNIQNQTDLWAELQAGKAQATWGQINGVLGDQTDLQNALNAAGDTAVWGQISGILADQTDLQNALDAKTNQTDFLAHTGDTSIHFTEGSISHLNIQDTGTNTHAQIDSHIADGSIHYAQTAIDHTVIQNVGTNTHAQIDSHIADTNIHYGDAPADGQRYSRVNNGWAVSPGEGGGNIAPGAAQGDMVSWNATAEEWQPTPVVRVDGSNLRVGTDGGPLSNLNVYGGVNVRQGLLAVSLDGATAVTAYRTAFFGSAVTNGAPDVFIQDADNSFGRYALQIAGNSGGLDIAKFHSNGLVEFLNNQGLNMGAQSNSSVQIAFQNRGYFGYAGSDDPYGGAGAFIRGGAPSNSKPIFFEVSNGVDGYIRAATIQQITGNWDFQLNTLDNIGSANIINTLTVGVEDSQFGYIILRGTATGANTGGVLQMDTAQDWDDTYAWFALQVTQDVAVFGTSVNALDGFLYRPAASRFEWAGNLMTNIADPINPQDAATKAYVDSAAGGGDFLPLAGGTLTGNLYVLADVGIGQEAIINSAAGYGNLTINNTEGGLLYIGTNPTDTVGRGLRIDYVNSSKTGTIGTVGADSPLLIAGGQSVRIIANAGDLNLENPSGVVRLAYENANSQWNFNDQPVANVGNYNGVGDLFITKTAASIFLREDASSSTTQARIRAQATIAEMTVQRYGGNASYAQIVALGNSAYLQMANQVPNTIQFYWNSSSNLEISTNSTLRARMTYAGEWNYQGNKLTNIGAPTSGGDATNKTYVDGKLVDGAKCIAVGMTNTAGAAYGPQRGCTVTLQSTGLYSITLTTPASSLTNMSVLATVYDNTESQQKIYVSYYLVSASVVRILTFDDGRTRTTKAITFTIWDRGG